MSFRSMLKHRCDVRSLRETVVDGASSYDWVISTTDLRCYVDLQLLSSMDPYFTPEGGRPTERAGRLFVEPLSNGDSPIRAGDTIVTTRGPKGTFKVENIIDEVWSPHRRHHYEFGITEVAPQIARKQVTQL